MKKRILIFQHSVAGKLFYCCQPDFKDKQLRCLIVDALFVVPNKKEPDKKRNEQKKRRIQSVSTVKFDKFFAIQVLAVCRK